MTVPFYTMGQCTSNSAGKVDDSPQKPPRGSKRRATFPGRKRKSKLSLSHAFNLVESSDATMELMDINMASEEALMTLPGINRVTASSIVQYRNAIGGYRKVEDLAVVSGVGAEKLRIIMPEITVSDTGRRNASRTSSGTRTPSVDSFPSSDSPLETVSIPRIVSINNCNIFQLMNATKINQETAANILHYRDKKGQYKYVDDLLKVKGVNRVMLNNIRQWIVTEPVEMSCRESVLTARSVTPRPRRNTYMGYNVKRRAISVPTRRSNGNSNPEISAAELYEALLPRCDRPAIHEVFLDMRHGVPAWRLASWNLQQFSPDKAANLGVKEVFCRTLLENGIGLVAAQEVQKKEALDKMCQELNSPRLRRVKEWEGPLGDWKCVASTQAPELSLGFVYDHSRGIVLLESFCTVAEVTTADNDVKPSGVFVAHFKVDNIEVYLINCQVRRQEKELVECMKEHVKQRLKQHVPVIIVGDFSVPPSKAVFASFREAGLRSLIPDSVPTHSSTEAITTRCWDNIWINSDSRKIYTDEYSVVRGGLTHPCIPRGWNWGGPLSEHCPVWAEFYSTPDPRPRGTAVSNGSVGGLLTVPSS